MLLVEVDQIGREIFFKLEEAGYQSDKVEAIIEVFDESGKGKRENLRKTLQFVCDFIKPRIEKITDEMDRFGRRH